MADQKSWAEIGSTPIVSANNIVSSAAQSGLPGVTIAATKVTNVIVNNFYTAPNSDAVSDEAFTELVEKIRQLEVQIETDANRKPAAFKCKESFNQCYQTAPTKLQKFHCLTIYLVCLGQGFPISGFTLNLGQ